MKNLKVLLALLLLGCMVFALCACGGSGDNTDTTKADTTNEDTTADTTQAVQDLITFTVNVVDADGKAVEGIMVQVCDDGNCFIDKTDANGKVYFNSNQITEVTSSHSLTIPTLPEQYTYEYSAGNKLYLESGITEYTVELASAN